MGGPGREGRWRQTGNGRGRELLDGVGHGSVLAGRYRLEGRVRTRPGGSLWRAVDETLDRPVLVQAFALGHPYGPEIVDAARRAALVEDPRLQRVLAAGEERGTAYVVLERLSGPHPRRPAGHRAAARGDRAPDRRARPRRPSTAPPHGGCTTCGCGPPAWSWRRTGRRRARRGPARGPHRAVHRRHHPASGRLGVRGARRGLDRRALRPPGRRWPRPPPPGRPARRGQRRARRRGRRAPERARADRPPAVRRPRGPRLSTSAPTRRSRSRSTRRSRRRSTDAPGSASVRLGAANDRQTPLESWLSLLFGPAELARRLPRRPGAGLVAGARRVGAATSHRHRRSGDARLADRLAVGVGTGRAGRRGGVGVGPSAR